MTKKILICDDHAEIRDFVVINLTRAGYTVVDVSNGEDALKVYEQTPDFDVVLLDVMMPPPGIDGFQVCKALRDKNPLLGIIMLTAKSQEFDKVNGLMLGADDYITKPFSPSELLARIDAIFRRVALSAVAKETDSGITEIGPFVLNTKSRVLTKGGKEVELTQVEFDILTFFMQNRNTALDRNTLLQKIWGTNYIGDDKIIDVNIRRIRMKIEDDPAHPKYISTVWGFGYKWTA
ncbi:MAG: response regulator transcription factor [Oscillospiraceae bacterium]|jgi:DNA-binding response OmpR family regulator|nr:response regulator transcription factor [Oscillospiraceae bacterium]